MDAIVYEPYNSLTAMRAVHGELADQIGKDILAPANTERVKTFIRRGAATGTVLDGAKERSAAQGLINFWVARLSAAGRTADGPNLGGTDLAPPFEETLLADFPVASVKQAAADAEAWFSALPPDSQSRAERALMRLVLLPADGKTFVAVPITRAALDSFGPPERIDEGLAALAAKQVVRLTPGETPEAGLIALRHEALTREWPRLAGWLNKRLRFRQAAQYWHATGQSPAALIRDDLLDEAHEYHDLDQLERQFIEASGKRARQQDRDARHLHRWLVGLFAAAAVGAVAAVILLWVAYRAATAREAAESMQKEGVIVNGLADNVSMIALAELLTQNDAHYAKKLLIIQSLGQLVSATSSEAWDAAKANWSDLEKDLRQDPANGHWFEKGFFPGRLPKSPKTNEECIAELTSSWESRRASRESLYWVSKFLDEYLGEYFQPDGKAARGWYKVVERTVTGLTDAAAKGRRFDEVAAFEGLFWRLYYGEMVLVESDRVEKAMVQFGNCLKDWDKQGSGAKAPADLVPRMRAAADALKAAFDLESKGDPSGE